jgi:hypothetical protein
MIRLCPIHNSIIPEGKPNSLSPSHLPAPLCPRLARAQQPTSLSEVTAMTMTSLSAVILMTPSRPPNLIHVSTCRPSDDCQLPSPRLAQNRVRVQEKEACAGSQNHKIVLEGSHHDCLFASLSRIRPGLGTQPVWSCTWTKARTTRVPICVPSTF